MLVTYFSRSIGGEWNASNNVCDVCAMTCLRGEYANALAIPKTKVNDTLNVLFDGAYERAVLRDTGWMQINKH